MSKSKKNKIARLTDEEYRMYIMSLKEDAALYNADGTPFVPLEDTPDEPPHNPY